MKIELLTPALSCHLADGQRFATITHPAPVAAASALLLHHTRRAQRNTWAPEAFAGAYIQELPGGRRLYQIASTPRWLLGCYGGAFTVETAPSQKSYN